LAIGFERTTVNAAKERVMMMEESAQQGRTEAGGIGLAEAASKPGADPCDLACDALPARVVGDLSAHDESWLSEHVDDCSYCANELRRYDRLADALDACCTVSETSPQPPAVTLPRRDRVWYTRIDSPIGNLLLAATREGLREIEFGFNGAEAAFLAKLKQQGAEPVRLERIDDADPEVRQILERAATQLHEYFGGRRARFDVPLDWGKMAPFQRAVLEATAAVPFGHLDTYAGIARRIGQPGATRAVGNALGRNPIPVIVPCHRIIRSDGTLGGYTGGLGIKHTLLTREGVTLA
jgi:methylated-DNA-[protein]-cysteine S-methyltransferase